MKKIFVLILSLLLLVSFSLGVSGCKKAEKPAEAPAPAPEQPAPAPEQPAPAPEQPEGK